jgi:hypothetical protein
LLSRTTYFFTAISLIDQIHRYGFTIEANHEILSIWLILVTKSDGDEVASVTLHAALGILLRFGAAMLRAGAPAFRVRQWMGVVARAMELDTVTVAFSLDSVTASVIRGDEHAMLIKEIEPPGVNVWRIGALEEIAKTATSGEFCSDLAPRCCARGRPHSGCGSGWAQWRARWS